MEITPLFWLWIDCELDTGDFVLAAEEEAKDRVGEDIIVGESVEWTLFMLTVIDFYCKFDVKY